MYETGAVGWDGEMSERESFLLPDDVGLVGVLVSGPVSGPALVVSEPDRRRLVRYRWPSMEVLDELAWRPSPCGCAVEGLVVSPSERLLVAWTNTGQGENGYEVYALDGPLRRLSHLDRDAEPCTLRSMYCWPRLSPDERLVVCSPGTNEPWWVPPEEDWPDDWDHYGSEWAIPSRGGRTMFATLVVHEIASDVATTHRLLFDLEAGWVPDDPEDPRWVYGAIDLAFTGDDAIRLQLPDGVWARPGPSPAG